MVFTDISFRKSGKSLKNPGILLIIACILSIAIPILGCSPAPAPSTSTPLLDVNSNLLQSNNSPPANSNVYTSVFAWGTLIAVEGGYKSIEKFNVGDKVIASGLDLHWETRTVAFSSGTGSGGIQPAMFYILYKIPDRDEPSDIITTADTTFLTPEKNFLWLRDLS